MSRHNMHNYIGGPIQIRTMFLFLGRDVKIGSSHCNRIPWRLESASSQTPSCSLGMSSHSTELSTNMSLRSIKWKLLR